MPDTVAGIPIHPLVVHAVVVLIPLSALGVIAIAVVPKWRERFGALVALVTLGAVMAIPVATQSGERLRDELGAAQLVAKHSQLGEQLKYFAIPLLLAAIALWWIGRRQRQHRPYGRGLTTTIAVLSVIAALAATVWVVRIGHSGATAVWGGVVTSASGP